ncbi:MAG: hypothetical protein ACRDSZ_13055 [Pseudonocardiaceae bacterium]
MAGRGGDPSPVPRGGCLLTEQSPSLLVGGRILDAGAVASWTAGELAIQSWLTVAPVLGLTFLLPELAVTETHTLRPHAGIAVEELVSHPHVVVTQMSSADAAGVEELLATSRTFDVMAGWVVHLCRQRGWNALTTDPSRLQRIDPQVPTELLL